jgi:hypothetical protein
MESYSRLNVDENAASLVAEGRVAMINQAALVAEILKINGASLPHAT